MRRLVSAAAVAAATLTLVVPSALAASPTISYRGLTGGWDGISLSCSTFVPSTLSPAHTLGPGTPPLGAGSLKVAESSGTLSGLGVDFASTTPSLQSVTAYDGYVYVPSSGGVAPDFAIDGSDPTTDYQLTLTTSLTDQWVHLDLYTATLAWQGFDDQTGSPTGSGHSTLADFITSHPGVNVDSISLGGDACGPGAFYLDGLNYNVGGTAADIDFEAPDTTSLVNVLRPTLTLSGHAVTIAARLRDTTDNGAPVVGQLVQLWARTYGGSLRFVKTMTTDSTGLVSASVAPTISTSYQWRYTGIGKYGASNASGFTVWTRQTVTVATKPTTVTLGRVASVHGWVRPAKSGLKIRLARLTSSGPVIIGTATTSSTGAFTVAGTMNVRGTANYAVIVLGYPGELQGQSAAFSITTQ